MGVVNHALDRRGSQFYAFSEQIFTRQRSWQKFIEISQIFTKFPKEQHMQGTEPVYFFSAGQKCDLLYMYC